MSDLEYDVKTFLKFLDKIYCNNATDWWRYNKERLTELGIDERDRVFYTILADDKKLIEFFPNDNRPNGRDETRMRITKYGHDNIDNLDPILLIRSNNNVKLN